MNPLECQKAKFLSPQWIMNQKSAKVYAWILRIPFRKVEWKDEYGESSFEGYMKAPKYTLAHI